VLLPDPLGPTCVIHRQNSLHIYYGNHSIDRNIGLGL
jgi:hypothetical protein